MSDAHVIILNWNGAHDTLECLESLAVQEGVRLDCVVVDNGSQDDSVAQIRTRFPGVAIVQLPENAGFPGGMNAGIRYALEQGAEHILVLNNDTIADPGMVRAMLTQLSGPVALVAPAIFYVEAPEKIWSIGGNIHPLLLELVKPHGGSVHLPLSPSDCDFVTGCAMLVRADVFRAVGLFDERFFPGYYEDLDFCLRIRRKDYGIRVAPQARLLHKVSQASGGRNAPKVLYLMGRNSGYYFRKHMALWQAPFIIAYRLGSAIKTTLRLAIQKDRNGLAAYWRGLAAGWMGWKAGSGSRYLAHYQSQRRVQ